MFTRVVGVALAVYTLGVPAFLLPPGISRADHEVLRNSLIDPNSQLIDLPCPSRLPSPFRDEIEDSADGGDQLYWAATQMDRLRLHFTVSDDQRRLDVNGTSIWPFDGDTLFDGFIVHIGRSHLSPSPAWTDRSGAFGEDSREMIPFRFHVLPERSISTEGDSVFSLQLEALGWRSKVMRQDRIDIDVLRLGNGELFILAVTAFSYPRHPSSATQHEIYHGPVDEVAATPFADAPSWPSPPSFPPENDVESTDEQCKGLPRLICSLMHKADTKFSKLGSDFHHHTDDMPMAHPTKQADLDAQPSYHHGRPHRMRPYGHHEHHHTHMLHVFARSLVAILVPVIAGVTVGLVISLLALTLARLFTFVWISCTGCGQQQQRNGRGKSSRANDLEQGRHLTFTDDEDDDEPLPVYEEAPAYEETTSSQPS